MDFRECLLLPSIAGRSSIHSGPLEPVEHLQTLRVLRTWGSAFSSHLRRNRERRRSTSENTLLRGSVHKRCKREQEEAHGEGIRVVHYVDA